MPSSYVDTFAPIVHAIIARSPARILDIGPGWGKYGLACREYLRGLDMLDAVEVPQGRISTQAAIYDNVFVGDASRASEQFFAPYDLVLMIDVIEHFTLDVGHELLARIQRAGADVLVSTPKVFIEQHDDNNPHETHLSLWSWDDLIRHDIVVDVSTVDSIVYILEGRR